MSVLLANESIIRGFWSSAKLWTSNWLGRLAYRLLWLERSLLNPCHRWTTCSNLRRNSCIRLAQNLTTTLRLFRFFIIARSWPWSLAVTAFFLSRIEDVLPSCTLLVCMCILACSWGHHLWKSHTICLCKIFVEWNWLLIRHILCKTWGRISPRTSMLSTFDTLVTVFEWGSQSGAIVLPVSAVTVKTWWWFACTIEHEKTSTCLWRECASEVLLATWRTWWGMTSGSASFRWVRRGMRWHDEERGWRFLDLLVRIMYAADQWINQLISRAMRQPFDEKLVNWALCNLKPSVSCELTCT